jgi:hypothetical protein
MKREFVLAIFLILFVGIVFSAEYIFGEEKIMTILNNYIVVWFMIVYYLGQYSMRFPKRF